MKLLGKDITPSKVMAYVGERLQLRGLAVHPESTVVPVDVEPRVDPLTFNLHALDANADATQGLPLETHRDGLAGKAIVLAKQFFRAYGQLFINEALGRQNVFNGHVRDSYAQLAAEVIRLRERVAQLEGQEKRSVSVAAMTGPLLAAETAKPKAVKAKSAPKRPSTKA